MPIAKCEALVIRRVYYRNTSLILTCLSREHGLLSCIAKGCREAKSPLFGKLDLFNCGELVYYAKPSGALQLISQFEPDEEALGQETCLSRFTAATFMAEVVQSACPEGEPLPVPYRLMRQALTRLRGGQAALPVSTVFGLLFLADYGVAPVLEACLHCGASLDSGAWLVAAKGGLVCAQCRPSREAIALEAGAVAGLRYLARYGDAGLERLNLRPSAARSCFEAVLLLIQQQLGIRASSGRFLMRSAEWEWVRHVA